MTIVHLLVLVLASQGFPPDVSPWCWRRSHEDFCPGPPHSHFLHSASHKTRTRLDAVSGPSITKKSSSHIPRSSRHGSGGFPCTHSHILDAEILLQSSHKNIFNLPTVRYIWCLPHQFVKGGKINLVQIQQQQD